jgi:LmbE family N-acetylglucosaminyl deacetylase
LLVLAHPDDESFFAAGTVARHVADGGEAALVCATRGERGSQPDPPVCDPADLGRVRARELRRACRIIGVSRLSFLGYPDQGLAAANPEEATERLTLIMRAYHPDATVTFGPEGIYHHPDHVAIHHFTVAAFDRIWRHPAKKARLWFVAPPSAFWRYRVDDWVVAGEDAGGRRGDPAPSPPPLDPLTAGGRPLEPGRSEAAIGIEGFLQRKIAALLAHRTQRHNVERTFGRFYDLAQGGPPRPEVRMTLGTEFFALGRGPRPPYVLEDSLIAGLARSEE